jgi:hypothetical protein
MNIAIPRFAVTGLKSTGIYPFNPDVLPEIVFSPSSVSEHLVQCNINNEQETLSRGNNQEAALTCSESTETLKIQNSSAILLNECFGD